MPPIPSTDFDQTMPGDTPAINRNLVDSLYYDQSRPSSSGFLSELLRQGVESGMSRRGTVLARGTILKRDHFPSKYLLKSQFERIYH